MRRFHKRIKVKTPGGKTVQHFKKIRASYQRCGNCGAKLNVARLDSNEIREFPKSKRRPERPYPNLCSGCMREVFKQRVVV